MPHVQPFDKWMRKVDQKLTNRIGLGSSDLPDAPWFDYWSDGLEPQEAIESSVDYTDIPPDLFSRFWPT